MAAPEVCFYCHSHQVHIGVCIDCRTKFDILKLDYERLKKQAEFMRRNRWVLIRENDDLRKALAGIKKRK
jgi:hypothetical protein